MDHDAKAAIETLTKTVQDGFASVEKRFASLDERMEQGFAAVAEDLADIKDRLTSVESKVSGTNRRLDTEAMYREDLALPKRVSDLEERTVGASRHPEHLPLR
jgi:tetrahydromethanopterin S-methyltransferase subunit G